MSNTGKIFENAMKRSMPDDALLYRIPDAAQSFGGSNKLRFSRKNPFDFIMWDSKRRRLFALEMKTVAGKSISFERNAYKGITCGFIIEFRSIKTTVFIDISDFNRLMNEISKKSFTKKDLDRLQIPYVVIPQSLIKTRYRYDVEHFMQDVDSKYNAR